MLLGHASDGADPVSAVSLLISGPPLLEGELTTPQMVKLSVLEASYDRIMSFNYLIYCVLIILNFFMKFFKLSVTKPML